MAYFPLPEKNSLVHGVGCLLVAGSHGGGGGALAVPQAILVTRPIRVNSPGQNSYPWLAAALTVSPVIGVPVATVVNG